MNYKILIVDDEEANLRLLERIFRREYHVITATSGSEGLELLKLHNVALIISDQRMPGMTGIEFLQRAAEIRPHTVRIILTGYTEISSLVEAINSGVVYKYVTKPWVNEDLRQAVVRGLEHYETIKSQFDAKLTSHRLTSQLSATRRGFVRLIANILDMKEPNLHGHLWRTSNYAVALGYRLNIEAAELEKLALAAFLHEISFIGIPNSFLQEDSLPTVVEDDQILKKNAERGLQLLTVIPDMEDVDSAIRHYTEHFDGNGQPEGLYGEQIPIFARIIAVASAYDLMTAPIVGYALSHEDAIRELQLKSGRKFDSRVVEKFSNLTSVSQIQDAIKHDLLEFYLNSSTQSNEANDLTTAELLQKFKTEPILAMQVLKSANISDNAEPTAQLFQAMTKVGEEKLRRLMEKYGSNKLFEDTFTSKRAVLRAIAAQLLAGHTNVMHPDEAYTMGLLQEVGEILLFGLFSDEMQELEELNETTRYRRQTELFGVDLVQVSQWMLASCKLPQYLTSNMNPPFEEMQLNNPIAVLLYLADKISAAQTESSMIDIDSIRTEALTILNLSRADLKAISERTNSIREEQANSRPMLYA